MVDGNFEGYVVGTRRRRRKKKTLVKRSMSLLKGKHDFSILSRLYLISICHDVGLQYCAQLINLVFG